MDDRMDWKQTAFLVTGGSGFLGSYVVDVLRARGAQNVAIPGSSDFDLTDMNDVRSMLEDTRPEVVIHLAARAGGIGANRQKPAEFFYANLMMGVQVMHESWKAGVKKFVAIGTVCSYPKFASVPFREDEIWSGYPEETNAPYGLAKKMMIVQAQAYRQQYGFNAINLLPVNLYGPRDHFDLETSHVIPALIRKCIQAKQVGASEIVLWGDGSPTREFLFAEDAAEGIVLATEKYEEDQPVNLGSGQEISIRDLVVTIAGMVGFSGSIVWDASKPNGQPRRSLDITRAREKFGFQAATSLSQGLRLTIDWYLRESAAGKVA